ncbi:flagellar protein FliT [Planococcus koreensis]|uniref:flagellar protein FliT n=1 Tax=Planococcus koreensis TaxID=112331 RepID=UPI0039FC86D2
MHEEYLKELLEQTRELLTRAKLIDCKMENNDDGQLEAVQALFENRQLAIDKLAGAINAKGFSWTPADREKIAELKVLEQDLQPLVTGLHEAFGNQLKRIGQSKKMSMKYIGAYQNMGAGGSFIDKRK